jgi:hypothetical protein
MSATAEECLGVLTASIRKNNRTPGGIPEPIINRIIAAARDALADKSLPVRAQNGLEWLEEHDATGAMYASVRVHLDMMPFDWPLGRAYRALLAGFYSVCPDKKQLMPLLHGTFVLSNGD